MDENKIKCGIFAPDYYTKFKCVADKCEHNCCLNWEICIDDKSLSKYKNIENIMNTITYDEDSVCFKLDNNGRCPHLNKNGLCNIIISHGEDYLCEICKNHPRFFNHVDGRRIEAGIGIACEEACRIVLENEIPFSLSKIDNAENDEFLCSFNALKYRNKIIRFIENSKYSFDEKLNKLQMKYKLMNINPEKWTDKFLSLEILDTEWGKILKSVKETQVCNSYDKYYERLLVYFIYRHVSVADNKVNLRARLAFAILSVKMIRYIFEAKTEKSLDKLIDYARRYSAEIEYCEENTNELIFNLEDMLCIKAF